jgi:hypothetical protein
MGGVENDKHQRIQKDVGLKEHNTMMNKSWKGRFMTTQHNNNQKLKKV